MMNNSLTKISFAAGIIFGLFSSALLAQPAELDIPPPAIKAAAGLWDLSIENSNRRCNITFSMASDVEEQPLRFPLLCKRALPVLAEVTGWRLGEGMILQLTGKTGETVLQFNASETDTALKAVKSDNEVYYLEPKQKPLSAARRPTPSAPAEAPPIAVLSTASPSQSTFPNPSAKPLAVQESKATPIRVKSIPGIYALDRKNDKSTCLIELMSPPPEPGKPGKARLLDTCRDEAMKVFSPLFWTFDNGKLSLIAKRGNIMILSQENNLWRRTGNETNDFALRRLE
jgi:hypothetical protein